VQVEIWSDVVCPWCYVGMARFEKALDAFPHADEVQVVHRSYELDPTAFPFRSEPVLAMLSAKFGVSIDQAGAMEQQLVALAAAEGLPFRADRLHGNTFTIHRLLHHATAQGKHDVLAEAVWAALFGEARDVFDPQVLTEIAVSVGLDAATVTAVIDGDAYATDVRGDEEEARALGVTGVPFFVLAGRYAIPGAQEVEIFEQALQKAWDDQASPVG
jgi:predicted DsbA family dithiol-disulfide isomerase